jgi:hypothetical protein
MKKMMLGLFALALLTSLFFGCGPTEGETSESETTMMTTDTCDVVFDVVTAKPVIYLYPEEETEVSVKLDYKGTLTCTYPAYREGWRVLASPDGTLTGLSDGREYSYLFWEGVDDAEYDLTYGYCVKGEDTAAFLQDTLAKMGLTAREYNEFIVYWLPKMQNNPYNLITFQGKAYTDIAPLEIIPAPDSMLRVFMVYKPLEAPIEAEEPEITPFERTGFTVIEWGGTMAE